MMGLTYGRLTVIREAGSKGGHKRVLCKCVCGNEKAVDVRFILSGNTKSCGCLNRDVARARGRRNRVGTFLTNPLDHIDEDIV